MVSPVVEQVEFKVQMDTGVMTNNGGPYSCDNNKGMERKDLDWVMQMGRNTKGAKDPIEFLNTQSNVEIKTKTWAADLGLVLGPKPISKGAGPSNTKQKEDSGNNGMGYA